MEANLGPQCSKPIFDIKTFKMETPETIQISFLQGEWVTSLDFSEAYFHIPIHPRSQKFLGFHFKTRHINSGPYPLSIEFICVVKEVKLMAQARVIRIHQYLDDWLIRALTRESCHHWTQSLLTLCQELGWVVNQQKSELKPKQVFELWVTNTTCYTGWSDRPRTIGSQSFRRYHSSSPIRLAVSGNSCL